MIHKSYLNPQSIIVMLTTIQWFSIADIILWECGSTLSIYPLLILTILHPAGSDIQTISRDSIGLESVSKYSHVSL